MELFQASRQWSTRPSDERFTSLLDMADHFDVIRNQSRQKIVSSRKIEVAPTEDNKGLVLVGPQGNAFAPTHWAFGQIAQLAEGPAGYLRTLPAPIAADCINYGLKFKRDIEEVGVLLQQNGSNILRAATGPRYGRIWNADVVNALVDRFGDGVTGDWRVPGEFGKAVVVDKSNTTLFAGDRDMFVFLADEERRIDVPNRRGGKSGSMARGFFVWNSEVGSQTLGIATFLYDYVCCNRIVWGADQYKEIRIRHTTSAPDRFIEEIKPALLQYSRSASASITEAIKTAQEARLDDVDDFLGKRFGKRIAAQMKTVHELEEGRPVESRWDAVTAATAFAKGVQWQDDRVAIERKAGEILSA